MTAAAGYLLVFLIGAALGFWARSPIYIITKE
jgi:hypothetical protein